MRKLIIFITSLVLFIGACTQNPDVQADVDAIKKLHNELTAASSNLDIDGVLALWTDDGIEMPPKISPFIGKERIRARLQFFNDVSLENLSVEIEEIKVSGDWAFIRQTFKGTWIPKDGSEPTYENSKEIMILNKQTDGSWKIARYIWNSNPAENANKLLQSN